MTKAGAAYLLVASIFAGYRGIKEPHEGVLDAICHDQNACLDAVIVPGLD